MTGVLHYVMVVGVLWAAVGVARGDESSPTSPWAAGVLVSQSAGLTVEYAPVSWGAVHTSLQFFPQHHAGMTLDAVGTWPIASLAGLAATLDAYGGAGIGIGTRPNIPWEQYRLRFPVGIQVSARQWPIQCFVETGLSAGDLPRMSPQLLAAVGVRSLL